MAGCPICLYPHHSVYSVNIWLADRIQYFMKLFGPQQGQILTGDSFARAKFINYLINWPVDL